MARNSLLKPFSRLFTGIPTTGDTGVVRKTIENLIHTIEQWKPGVDFDTVSALDGGTFSGSITEKQDLTVNKRLFVSPGGPTSTTNGGMLNGDILADRGDGTGVIFFGQHAAAQGKYLYWNGTKYVLGDQDQILQTSQVYQSSPSILTSTSTATVNGSFGGDINWTTGPAITLNGTYLVHAFATVSTANNADAVQLALYDQTAATVGSYGPSVTTPAVGYLVSVFVPLQILTLSNHTLSLYLKRNGGSTPSFNGTAGLNMQGPMHGIWAMRIN